MTTQREKELREAFESAVNIALGVMLSKGEFRLLEKVRADLEGFVSFLDGKAERAFNSRDSYHVSVSGAVTFTYTDYNDWNLEQGGE